MTIKELIKQEGSVAAAHRWLVRKGLDLPYETVFHWSTGKTHISSAYSALLLTAGIKG